jgi:hypothetical protein
MDMILTDHSAQDLYLVTLTDLADKLPYADRKIPYQHGIAVFGDPNEVVLDLVFCVATLAIFHDRQYKSAASRMLPA